MHPPWGGRPVRARGPFRSLVVPCALLLLLLVGTVGGAIAPANARLPPLVAPHPSNVPLNYNVSINAVGGVSQPVTNSNDTLATAVPISLASPLNITVVWSCAGVPNIREINVEFTFFGFQIWGRNVIFTQGNPCAGPTPQTSYTFADSDFTTYKYIVSGTYSGAFSITDPNGSYLGDPISFYVKFVPPTPLTVLTLAFLLVIVYEVYTLVEGIRLARHPEKRPKRRSPIPPPASEPSPAPSSSSAPTPEPAPPAGGSPP
jgi:hypothetical protein